MDIDSAVEQGEIPSAADSDPLSSTRDDTIEHRIGMAQITAIICIESENVFFYQGY